MMPWSLASKIFALTVLATILIAVLLIQNENRSELVARVTRFGEIPTKPSSQVFSRSELADLVNSPLQLATGIAKERIDDMLKLDSPGISSIGDKHKATEGKAKIKCTSLVCGEAGWENDYLDESERRSKASAVGPDQNGDISLGAVISQLQAKLESMKTKFRLIRAR